MLVHNVIIHPLYIVLQHLSVISVHVIKVITMMEPTSNANHAIPRAKLAMGHLAETVLHAEG